MNERKQYLYNSIIQSKLGKDFTMQVDYIKQEQCSTCKNKKKCKLVIKDNKCINFKE